MNKKLKELLEAKQNKIFSVNEKTTIKEAVDILVKNHIGSLIVVSDKGEIQGIFTEKDVMKKLASTDDLIGNLPVKELMTPRERLIVGHETDTVEYLMQIMTEKNIRHIPIMSSEGKLIGVLSMRDVVRSLLKDSNKRVKFLNDYISGRYPA
jgi:CBS domain-containing protein